MTDPKRLGASVIGILAAIAVVLVFLATWEWTREASSPESATSPAPLSAGGAESGRAGPEPYLSAGPELRARELSESDNLEVKALNDEGLAFYVQGDYVSAADRFQKAFERKPSDPVLAQNLSNAKGSQAWKLIEEGSLREALLLFQEAVDLNEKEAAFYVGIGLIHHRLQEDDNAIAMLKQAISIRSDDPQPYLILGEIYYTRDEPDLAVGYLEKALDLQPNDPAIQDRLARARRDHRTQGEFRRQSSLHFAVRFEGPEQYDAAQEVIDLLEAGYMDIGRQFFFYPESPIPVILYSKQQFRDVTLTPAWSNGLFDGKIRIPIEGIRQDPALLKKVAYHEYVHALVYAMAPIRIPTWLSEGLALNFEGSDGKNWDRILKGHLQAGRTPIPLRELDGSFLSFSEQQASMAYAESHSATRLLIERYGVYEIKSLLLDLADRIDFETAFENRFAATFSEFEQSWRSEVNP